jgi:hypothetical protein
MDSVSIHPRCTKGRQVHEKRNTAKPYKSGKGKLGKAMKRLARRRLAHSLTLKVLPAKDQLGFKTPGSMNPKRR